MLQRVGIFVLMMVLGLTGCAGLGQALSPTALPAATAVAQPATAVPVIATSVPTVPPPPTVAPSPSTVPTPEPTAEPLPPTPTLAPLEQTQRQQVFDEIWELVRDRYVYTDFNGLDWNAIRAEYQPKVESAATPEDFYALMGDLVDRLNDQHSGFRSPREVAFQEEEFRGTLKYGGIGALVHSAEDGGVITKLAPGGPAEQAGLEPREIIVAVNGIPYTDTRRFGAEGAIGRVRGAPGTSVTLTIRGRDGALREVSIVRRTIPSDAFPSVESQRLANQNVAVVLIDTFYLEDLDQLVKDELEQVLATGPLDGLILDLRENGGGQVSLMLRTIGLFHDGGMIGKGIGRDNSYDLEVPSGRVIEALRDVPIVVLTGESTESAGEMFSAGMQLLGRAKVVGTPSAGNTENLSGHNLSDGSQLWLAEWAYTLPDGSLIEGRGVQPDQTVEAEYWRFDLNDDPQVQAALKVMGF